MISVRDDYPSRCGKEERIIPRHDPVVYGSPQPERPYSLDREQLDFYAENGYLVLPEYMPEMVEPLNREIDVLRERMQGYEELYTEPDSEEVRTIFKPFAYSDLVDRFSRDPKILTVAEQILDSAVYIMQSRINVKPAYHGKSFSWHSDFETWHVEDGVPNMRMLTAWIMLSDNGPHNGPLYVVPGSHQHFISCAGTTAEKNYQQSLKRQTAGVPQPKTMDRMLNGQDIVSVEGKPGTVVFHECNILHGSPDNITNVPRSLLMFVYNSVKNTPLRPFSGQEPRPHYLSNPDHTPLRPYPGQRAGWHYYSRIGRLQRSQSI